MNKFWVILKETYRKNVQSIGFIVMVLSPLLILGIGLGIGYYVTNTQEENLPIAVITENPEIKDVLLSEGIEIEPTIQSEDQANDALTNETIEAYAVIFQENDTVEVEYVTSESIASPTAELVRGALTLYQTQLRGNKLNLSSQDLERLTSPIIFEENYVSIEDGIVEPEDQAEYEGSFIKQGAAYLVSIGIFIFVMTYASIIAQEIASEKGTRIMEVILSSVSSSVHFFGKLLGILLVCLTQITLYVVIGLIAYKQLKNIDFVQNILSLVDFNQLDTAFIGSSIILFALGIILFVVLAAFFGSLVTKIEDVNKAVTPVVYIALAGFYGVFSPLPMRSTWL